MYSRYFPSLLKLGIPIMVGQLGTIVMGIADTVMVGQHGTEDLAAAGFANNIVGLFLIAGMGFSYGLTPVVSSLVGQGRRSETASWLKNSLTANGLLALLMMAMLLLLTVCLPYIGMPDDLIPLMQPYMLVLTLSILPQMAFNALKQFSEGIQDTRTPMWVLLSGNALNVVGNWLLIFGVCGCPELGLLGAGIATLLSRIYMWAAMMWLFRHSPRFGTLPLHYRTSSINVAALNRLTHLGYPVMLQLGMEAASFSLSAFYVGWLGTNELAAHQVMITVGQLCFMLYYGMAAAVAIKVGFYRGADRLADVQRAAMSGLLLTLLMGFCIILPIFLLRHQVGWWFTDSSEVASLVAIVILPMSLYQIGDALQCTYANALRGMADVRPMIRIAFIAYFLISLPLGWFFGFVMDWELMGVWMAFPFGLTSAGIMYYRRFVHCCQKATLAAQNNFTA